MGIFRFAHFNEALTVRRKMFCRVSVSIRMKVALGGHSTEKIDLGNM